MKRNVVNKPAKIQCQICDKEISGYGFTSHLKTHGVSTNEYVSKFGEYKKSKLKPIKKHKRKINKITCKICNKEYASVGMSGHLRDTHNMTTEEYINIHGEFRPGYIRYKQKADKNKIVCLECNTIHGSERMLTFHLRMKHEMTRKEYTIKHVFKYEKQLCKCGCEQEVKILRYPPYRREYISGHNSFGENNGMYGKIVTQETRKQMSASAIKRMYNSKHANTSIELIFKQFLDDNNIEYIQQYVTNYGAIDFYLIKEDILVEIDGQYWHPIEKTNLNFQLLANSIGEHKKAKLNNLYRIREEDVQKIKSIADIKKYDKHPNLNLTYKQHVIAKDYFNDYINRKGKDKLNNYIPLLLKFLREFQPGFPYPDTQENIIDIVTKIQNYDLSNIKNDSTFRNTCSCLGISYLKANFKSYWHSSYKRNLGPIEAYYSDKVMSNVIKYRIGVNNSGEIFNFSLHQMIRGLSAYRHTISFFKPILAASIYKELIDISIVNPVTLDPCAGFGGRLLAFISLYPNGKYIGIEPNVDTYNELVKLKDELIINNITSEENIDLYNCKFEDFDTNSIDYDICFTSIPYYDAETYSQVVKYNSFDIWNNEFITSLMNLDNCYINMSSELYDRLEIKNDIKYHIQSNTSHFNLNKDTKREYIIKF